MPCHQTRYVFYQIERVGVILAVCVYLGTLCGECVNGTTVGVLRTKCRKCTENNYYAVALLGKHGSLYSGLRGGLVFSGGRKGVG